jgi:hypothetical protein
MAGIGNTCAKASVAKSVLTNAVSRKQTWLLVQKRDRSFKTDSALLWSELAEPVTIQNELLRVNVFFSLIGVLVLAIN